MEPPPCVAENPARSEFEGVLRKWHKDRGACLKIPPIFSHKEMDLLKMWKLVRAGGGSKEVCRKKRWAAVGRHFNPPSSMTNLSFHVKRIYDKYLLSYEQEQHPEGAMESGVDARLVPMRPGPMHVNERRKPKKFGGLARVPTRKRTQLCRPRMYGCHQDMGHLKRRKCGDSAQHNAVHTQGFAMSDEDTDLERQGIAAEALQQLSGMRTPTSQEENQRGSFRGGELQCSTDNNGAKSEERNFGDPCNSQDSSLKGKARTASWGSSTAGGGHSPSKKSQPNSEGRRVSTYEEIEANAEDAQHLTAAQRTPFGAEISGPRHCDPGNLKSAAGDMFHREGVACKPQPSLPVRILPSTVMTTTAEKDCLEDGLARHGQSALMTATPDGMDLSSHPPTLATALCDVLNGARQPGCLAECYQACMQKISEEHETNIAELKEELEKERAISAQKDAQIQVLKASKEEVSACFRLLLEKVQPVRGDLEANGLVFRRFSVAAVNPTIQGLLTPAHPVTANAYGANGGSRS